MEQPLIQPDLKKMINDNEEVLFRIKRHPFGLVSVYAAIVFGLAAAFAILIFTSINSEFVNSDHQILGLVAMSLALFITICILAVASFIYWSSTLTLTTEEVQQRLQIGLFNNKSSRLGLANVEDVTVSKKGVFQSMFNFGTLNIETAGEQSNFKFNYCPSPEVCAKAVMDAREAYLINSNQPTVSRVPR